MVEKIKKLENELFPIEQSIESEESSWMNNDWADVKLVQQKEEKKFLLKNKKLFCSSAFFIKKILAVDYAKINNFNKNNAQNPITYSGRKNIFYEDKVYSYETSIDSIHYLEKKIIFISKNLPFIFDFTERRAVKNLQIGKRAENMFILNGKIFIANEKMYIFSPTYSLERIVHLNIKNIIYLENKLYAIFYENKIGIFDYASTETEKIEILHDNIFKFYGMIFYAKKNYLILFLNNSLLIYKNKKIIKKLTVAESRDHFLYEKYLFFIAKNHLRIFDCEKLAFVDMRKKIATDCFFVLQDKLFIGLRNKIFTYTLF